MSLLLPPTDHYARPLVDVADLAEMCSPQNRMKLPRYCDAKVAAAAYFKADPAAKRVHVVTLRMDGQLQLIAFGPKGGHKVVWNFGKL